MRVFKWLGVLGLVYIVLVFLFETILLGYNQPSFEDEGGCSGFGLGCGIPMIVITTTDDKGQLTDRMLARFNSTDGKIYVSAHHWPRGWYKEAIKNPNVKSVQIVFNIFRQKSGICYICLIYFGLFGITFHIFPNIYLILFDL